MASDTNATTDPQAVEVIEPEVASSPDPLGLGALMGGIDLDPAIRATIRPSQTLPSRGFCGSTCSAISGTC